MKSALRLRRPADFARVKRFGKTQRHAALSVNFYANQLSRNRYGIVVSKRQGMAVCRNRIKRRLRAALSELHCGLGQGFDIVLVARRGVIAQPFDDLRRILSELFRRAQLIETA